MFNFGLKGLNEWFILGKKGPMIKKDGDKIAFKNHDDSALINVQALDPVDVQDVITKQYFDDNTSLVPYQTCLSLYSKVLYTDASKQIGALDVPNLGLVYAVQIKVITPFDGTNPVVTIGTDTTNDRLMTLSENDLKETGLFYLTLSDIFSATEAIKAFVTPDSSTQGEIDVTVLYTQSEEVFITPVTVMFDSNFTDSSIVLSNSDLTSTKQNVAGPTYVWTVVSPKLVNANGGKYFIEFNADATAVLSSIGGFIADTLTPTTDSSASGQSIAPFNVEAGYSNFYINSNNGIFYLNNAGEIAGVSIGANDKITIAIDLDNQKIWLAHNGNYYTGDPNTLTGGTNLLAVASKLYTYFAIAHLGNDTGASFTIQTSPTYPVTGFTNLGA